VTCSNCQDFCRVAFDVGEPQTKYVPCWECERGQRIMGIGPRYHGAEVRQFPPHSEALLAWRGKAPGWYLFGGVGRGKTHLAAAIARNQASRGRSVRFLSSANLLEFIKATYDKGSERADQALYDLARYEEADVVIIDDLGAERSTEWAEGELTRWIDGFYNREAALVVTSNLDLDQLGKQLGPRIASRIAGMTMPLPLTGPDRRFQPPPFEIAK